MMMERQSEAVFCPACERPSGWYEMTTPYGETLHHEPDCVAWDDGEIWHLECVPRDIEEEPDGQGC